MVKFSNLSYLIHYVCILTMCYKVRKVLVPVIHQLLIGLEKKCLHRAGPFWTTALKSHSQQGVATIPVG